MRPLLALAAALLLAPAVAANPLLSGDAGSGRDAPNVPQGGIPILPGVVYEGAFVPGLDSADYYAFEASAGQPIDASVWPMPGCVTLFAPDGERLAGRCVAAQDVPSARATATLTGTYHLGITQPLASTAPYRFSVAVGAVSPDPTPEGVWSLQESKYLQPGERVRTDSGSCTLNFAYNGTGSQAGKVYVGTAAHCFVGGGVGSLAYTSYGAFGRVVYMGDYSGINTGTYENGMPGRQGDFALIEVFPEAEYRVKGDVKGHPGYPTAVKASHAVRTGDRLVFSGYGTGFGANPVTREERVGVYYARNGGDWSGFGPIASGDSGGPVLHHDGTALGVASYIRVDGRVGGVFIDVALQEAAAAGVTVQLRPAY